MDVNQIIAMATATVRRNDSLVMLTGVKMGGTIFRHMAVGTEHRFDIAAGVGVAPTEGDGHSQIGIVIPGPTGLVKKGAAGIIVAVSAKPMVVITQPESVLADY
jgi:hypothetical protein